MKKSKIILIFVFCILNLIYGCTKKQEANKQDEIIPVKVTRVELKDIYKTLEYVGDIKAMEEVVIYPKVSGKIIEKIKQDGSVVEKGDAIFYIDRDEVGLKFEKAPVESPIDGVVGRIYVDIGANVTTQTPVSLVISMNKVKIGLNVPEKYVASVSVGQKARIYVDAYPSKEFEGLVTKISPVLDIETRSMPVEIIIDNKEHFLRSGMFARVSLIIDEKKQVPLLLKESIMGKGDNTYVYIIENNKAFIRKVKLGIKQNEYFQAKEGVSKGDLVVIMGQQRLKDGLGVKIEQ
ncbi:MAG: hypothetical protein COW92_02420 [Candidatus Omnitrophica bacterium CG22_combo_CG10-13_8_21_14_all_43_16]|nr:MAG: hypothetical protein COW92_02420 [Candidatus Omnitrophica bacterium CG22_combo_CG10-13_8_21_14_all_43_16]